MDRVARLALPVLFVVACAGGSGGDTVPGAGGGGGDGGSSGSAGASGGVGSGGSTSPDGGGSGGSATADASTTGAGSSGGSATGGASGSGGTMGGGGGTGGAAGAGSGICDGGAAASGDVTVNLADLRQRISGFGASTAWGSSMSANDAALLWSTTTGAGLSLHRVRIDPTTGRTSEINIAKSAVSYGVTVWATPWTPPGGDKTGCSGTNCTVEGTLASGKEQDYATFLKGFVTYMQGQGVPIFAVSAQNEPDANVTYESCVYTGGTMDAFITGFMGPTLVPTGVKIMGPETQNWCGFPSFEPTLVNNSFVSIVATHEYGCSVKAYPDIAQAGKEFWETEIYDTASSTADPGMASALRVGKLINDALTIANMNAWHYWWVYPLSADNEALWDFNTKLPTKRLWVEGNFARFVRPGFNRVGTTGTLPAGVLLTAYTNRADGTVVIVAINNNTSSTPLSLFVSGAAPCSLTPWVTSSNDDLASKAALSVSSSRTSFTLGAQSVTTFVGKP